MAILTPGQTVRQRRAALALSRERLAADVGVSTSMIVRLERDDKLPNVLALRRIAARLDLSIEDLARVPERSAS